MQHGENKEEKYGQRNYHTESRFDEYVFLILYLVTES